MTEKTNEQQTQTDAPEEVIRGSRGEIGEPTASLTIKQRWHDKHFHTVSVKNKEGVVVRTYLEANEGALSLKQFAKTLVQDGDQVAKDWFAHKAGSLNQARSDANIKAARECAAATKAAKRKAKKTG